MRSWDVLTKKDLEVSSKLMCKKRIYIEGHLHGMCQIFLNKFYPKVLLRL